MKNDPLLLNHPDVGEPPADVGGRQAALFAAERLSLTRLGFLLTGSTVVAEELVQDAFEQVVRRWELIDQPAGYLRSAVMSGARSWGRRKNSPLFPQIPPTEIDHDATAVRDALAELSHQRREVLVLRYFVGLSDSQISNELDRPIGSVKSDIRRGLARMREVLQ